MLLSRIIKEIPCPTVGSIDDKVKLFLLNSWFVNGKNVICLFYVMAGRFKKNVAITSSAFNKNYQIFDVGLLQPELNPQE
jgi:translation factor GUF1, mitochondrial